LTTETRFVTIGLRSGIMHHVDADPATLEKLMGDWRSALRKRPEEPVRSYRLLHHGSGNPCDFMVDITAIETLTIYP